MDLVEEYQVLNLVLIVAHLVLAQMEMVQQQQQGALFQIRKLCFLYQVNNPTL